MIGKVVVCILAILGAVNALQVPKASRGRFGCIGTATYKIEVNYTWSRASHPDAYPGGAHFSGLVAAGHGKYYTMWNRLGFASQGVQDVAEFGGTTRLVRELRREMSRNVNSFDTTFGAGAAGKVTATVNVNGSRSFISAVSMIAPSPDWIVGFSRLNMCDKETGMLKDMVMGDLGSYDVGTDAGSDFTSPDAPLRGSSRKPIISIGRIFSDVPLGTYTITKME